MAFAVYVNIFQFSSFFWNTNQNYEFLDEIILIHCVFQIMKIKNPRTQITKNIKMSLAGIYVNIFQFSSIFLD